MKEILIIDELKKQLDLLDFDKSVKERIDKKFRLEFNYNTNHIEGNTITYSETELLLMLDQSAGNHTLRELEEMKGSDVAYQLIKDLASENERPLTEHNIKNLNQVLLVRPFWKDALTEDGQATRRQIKVGEYKEYPNSVRLQNGEMFHYASPTDTPILMGELIDWFREEEEKNELHPVILAALFHYKFVCIHPFDDGNGRLSRLLMNYVLLKNNLPPVIIKSEDKKNYLMALNKADVGDVDSFVKYIAEQLKWSLEISIKAAKGESIDEPGDAKKRLKLLKQNLQIKRDKEVLQLSTDVKLNLFDKVLSPFFKEVSNLLNEYKSLFKTSYEYLTNGRDVYGADIESSITNIKNTKLQPNIDRVVYFLQFSDLLNSNFNGSFKIEFVIIFHKNVYDVIFDNLVCFSKYYDDLIEKEEISLLLEKIGIKILNEIELKLK